MRRSIGTMLRPPRIADSGHCVWTFYASHETTVCWETACDNVGCLERDEARNDDSRVCSYCGRSVVFVMPAKPEESDDGGSVQEVKRLQQSSNNCMVNAR